MKNYKTGEFADKIGVTKTTLINWDKSGKLKPDHIAENGYRYYTQSQLDEHLGIKTESNAGSNNEVAFMQRQLESKDRQIEEKDQQIRKLNEIILREQELRLIADDKIKKLEYKIKEPDVEEKPKQDQEQEQEEFFYEEQEEKIIVPEQKGEDIITQDGKLIYGETTEQLMMDAGNESKGKKWYQFWK